MHRDTAVVVGFDGSGRARNAVLWGAREAARRDLALRLVHAVPYPSAHAPTTTAAAAEGSDGDCGFLDHGLQLAHTILGADRVSGVCVPGHPAGVLVAESSRATLMVVGQRYQDAPVSSAIGSTSMVLASHVRCPLVVARGALDPRRAVLPVVLAVGPGLSSRAALDFAASTALLRGVPLTIVSAWSLPPATEWPHASAGFDSVSQWVRATATRAAEAAHTTERQVHDSCPTLVTRVSVERRDPAAALVQCSRRAGLLVIGSVAEPCARSRDMDPWRGLGTVGTAVLGRAACPVAVVPDL